MDGDIFGAVTRLGRAAAEAVAHALDGGEWDRFSAFRCLDVLHAEAGGLPTLPGVLRELEDLRSAPLLAHTQREAALGRINHVHVNTDGVTTLDLILRSAAERSVLSGEYEPVQVLERYFGAVLDGAILSPRGGYFEIEGYGRQEEARLLLAPIAALAAETLARRPEARRLRLAQPHANIQADTNLLPASE